ncbi:MAG: crossover junction endodeoxyribonuclease RuvC [Opitutales bacterium]|nr:crossover junction endodeoxyribonuclease RuvC [Opitutales bacterium]
MPRKNARALWAAKLAGKGGQSPLASPVSPLRRRPYEGVVLGIDPSLRAGGLAVLLFARGVPELLDRRTVRSPATFSAVQCLGRLASAVTELLDKFPVRHVAVEETIYVQNFRTAQILGAARGAAIAPAAMRALPVFEYAPLRVKQAVAGFGRASKEQVAAQMRGLLRLTETLGFDEADAAAVAYCHAFTFRDTLPEPEPMP